jgi:hypothetical protein
MNCMYSHRDGVLFRHCEHTPVDLADCVLEWCEEGRDESNHSPIRVQNACGLLVVEPQVHSHKAWRRSRSIFGVVHKAFTLAGNFVLQHGRISFKGAIHSDMLRRVARDMVCGDFGVKLQLMVLAMGIGMTLDVRVGCLLEKRLGGCHWVSVMGRNEEVCNVVVFYVRNWSVFNTQWPSVPLTTTVSLTRKGTMTVRLTWDGIDWSDNQPFESALQELASFVRSLI